MPSNLLHVKTYHGKTSEEVKGTTNAEPVMQKKSKTSKVNEPRNNPSSESKGKASDKELKSKNHDQKKKMKTISNPSPTSNNEA
eukprot:2165545-Ditylum_brightwellii.AAC.1